MKRRLFAGFTLFALLISLAASAFAGGKETDFTDNGDGTVIDNNTGLIWQKTDDDIRRNWQGAMDYCNNNTAGLPGGGWRLPNSGELKAISPADVFNGGYRYFWSASLYGGGLPNDAYGVNFASGQVHSYGRTITFYVRCVR